MKNYLTEEQRKKVHDLVASMTREEKAGMLCGADFWKTKDVERLGIPRFMMCDGPNGLRKQIGEGDHLGINESIETVCYPTASAMAASFDTDLMEELGERLGDECVREKVSMLLGPGINMKRSPLCGRNFEYYSEDPYLAGELASAYVKGLQSRHISACPKHFAGNNQEYRRMSGNSVIDERTFHEIYLQAFERMVKKADPHSIMCSYNQVNGTFSSENRELLTDILREKWGFDGFVVTDWGAGKDAVRGVEAGLDLVMPGGSDAVKTAVLSALEAGTLEESKVDAAVENLLGTFLWSAEGQPAQTPDSDEKTRETDYAFARKAEENSAVLLKNEGGLLPLSEKERVVFIGAFAEKPRYQGSGSSHIHSAKVVSALEAAEGRNIRYAKGYGIKDLSKDGELCREAVELAKDADKVVIFAGLPDAYESEGFDRKSLDMPENQNRLIEAVARVNPSVAVVLHNGAAVTMPWIDRVQAVLELYLGGDAVGEAALNLLFGKVNPSGKLAETFPLALEHNPSFLNFPGDNGNPEYREGVFIGYRYYDAKKLPVLFPFGHGLSYTSFSYSGLKLDRQEINGGQGVNVTVTVTNTGAVPGKEVVQVYVKNAKGAVSRPVQELKGFAKVELEPGASRDVVIPLDGRAFAYYETKIHDFYVPSGEYEIAVGSSSQDIRLRASVRVTASESLPVHFNAFSTMGEVLATPAGQQLFAPMLEKRGGGDTGNDALGEGGEEMAQAMMLEMPLSSLVTFGVMSKEQLEGVIAALNA